MDSFLETNTIDENHVAHEAKKEIKRKKALEYYYQNKDKIQQKNKELYQSKMKVYYKEYQQSDDYKQKKIIYNKKYYEAQRIKLKEYEELKHHSINVKQTNDQN